MRQHRQGREDPLDDHPHVGPGVGRGDEGEAVDLLHPRADRLRGLGAELLDEARVDVELHHLALGVALQALVERQVPAGPQAQHVEHAVLGEVAADLLRHPHPDVLGDLLGPARMRGDLGHRLQDQVQVADRDPLGEQQLQHRLEARIGDLRRADLVEQALVFGVEPVEEGAHVLVGQELRQVVADHLGEVGEQHRGAVDRLEAAAAHLRGVGIHHPQRLQAEGGLAHLVARHVGLRPVADHHQHLAGRSSWLAATVPWIRIW